MNLFKNFNWNFWEKKNAPSEHNINIQYDSLSSFFKSNIGKQAYLFSVVANSAIEIIVKAIINIPLETQIVNNKGEKQIRTDLDISPLLTRANPRDTFESLFESLAYNYLLYGNTYLQAFYGSQKEVQELYCLPSDQVTVNNLHQNDLFPSQYQYLPLTGKQKIFTYNQINNKFENNDLGLYSILKHLKTYNPNNQFEGLPPLHSAETALDIHKAGLDWNKATLQGSGVPSGLLTPTAETIDENAFKALGQYLEKTLSGAKKGRSMILVDKGLEYKQLSMSALDMDFIKQNEAMTRYISQCLGVPFVLVDPASSTFNNQEQAYRILYNNAVIPLLNKLLKYINSIISESYPDQEFVMNRDQIGALESERVEKFKRMIQAKKERVITTNECRIEIGFDAVDDDEANELMPMSLGLNDNTRPDPFASDNTDNQDDNEQNR